MPNNYSNNPINMEIISLIILFLVCVNQKIYNKPKMWTKPKKKILLSHFFLKYILQLSYIIYLFILEI